MLCCANVVADIWQLLSELDFTPLLSPSMNEDDVGEGGGQEGKAHKEEEEEFT